MDDVATQQYFEGYSIHQFEKTETFKRYYKILEDINNNDLKEEFQFIEKYPFTKDLRPKAYEYDDSIIDVLIDAKVPEILRSIVAHDLYLHHVQIRKFYKN